ncbi:MULTISPECIES: hypothetical protein [Amycolatopsis]|uniref:Uncharacterized protein n=1 Tax=Amycolatopsis echigonensis TaxID=2576905 RepID=A0A2N3WLE6_9PSEU|nr:MULTISPECIES: hypothetical protein [Amycolatopsis]MBB2500827.1 hypothetical protein [Amycolatopsis echigonensis]MCG3751216.1 hypothetical protein [Amycolatopsis sp. Poz14]PKV94680.1 hypothetical protein ATK30_5560 [Amycolatopsis niigatensis]
MDLTAWLLQRISVRPLLVSTVGGTAARLAAEQRVRRRGWRPALNPAEANLLIVAGPQDPAMEPFLEAVWRVVPEPRSRADIADPAEADAKLTEAEQQLRSGVLPPDADLDRHEAARSQHPPADNHGMHGHEMHHGGDAEPGMGHGGHDMSKHGHQAHDSDDGGHQGHDMGHSEHQSHDMGHSGHHGHDMGGMSMPGGIPMADRADDRDGLKLDRLTVPLGPVLPAWPAGLLVRTTLQGDVIQEAEVEAVRGHPHGMEPFWDTLPLESTRIAARRLDSCARLLSVAGWEDAAVAACRLRDDLLAGRDVGGQLARWARRVRRSRTLRWSLSGLGRLDRGALAGDTADRLYRWLDEATGTAPATVEDPDEILALLPDLLAGAELAAARLIVAGLDPDLERTRVTHA